MRGHVGRTPWILEDVLQGRIDDLAAGRRDPLVLAAYAALDAGQLAECLEIIEQMQRHRITALTPADPPE